MYELVTIFTSYSQIEAILLTARLEDEGIGVLELRPGALQYYLGILPFQLYSLQIFAKNVPEAVKVVDEFQNEGTIVSEGDEFPYLARLIAITLLLIPLLTELRLLAMLIFTHYR